MSVRLPNLGSLMEPSWGTLGRSWRPLGPSWGHLGAPSGRFGALLEAPRGNVWGPLGPPWFVGMPKGERQNVSKAE
eukprot:2602853-Pyramimonas_sp.AAC.1